MVNGFQSLTISTKSSIIDVWLNSEYASVFYFFRTRDEGVKFLDMNHTVSKYLRLMFLTCKIHSIDLQPESIDWLLYDRIIGLELVKHHLV